MSNWYKKAVLKRRPNELGGWGKDLSAGLRRELALKSNPGNWTREHQLRRLISALTSLRNVSQDTRTREVALADQRYFSRLLKELKKK